MCTTHATLAYTTAMRDRALAHFDARPSLSTDRFPLPTWATAMHAASRADARAALVAYAEGECHCVRCLVDLLITKQAIMRQDGTLAYGPYWDAIHGLEASVAGNSA